jgi:hypothetical protein
MAGNANKIISNGTSAGGAMSSLLGATGNHPDYEPYLQEIGAAMASDDIFAVSAYCPITNLEHADMAYEWQLHKEHAYDFIGRKGTLSKEELSTSHELKNAFPIYLSTLHLKNSKNKLLKLNASGNGNFKDLIVKYLIASAQTAIDKGTDINKLPFLKIKKKKVVSLDFDGYMSYLGRMKKPPAFDGLEAKSFENSLFGTDKLDAQHFTNYSMEHSKMDNPSLSDISKVKMMNPMNYIKDKTAAKASYWRIRHGAKDKDTSFAIPLMLALQLQNNGINVDFALPWDKPHSGDYDLDELFDWVDALCKKI